MCGRFTNYMTWDDIANLYRLVPGTVPLNLRPQYNIAPGQPVLVIYNGIPGRPTGRTATFMIWGLVPSWSKGPDTRYSMINARAETINVKPAYKGAFRHRRCLIPANGFYEWRKLPDGSKQPYYISAEDGDILSFAGVWEDWLGPDGSEIDSFAIVTVPGKGMIRQVHDRMPVILPPDTHSAWLDPETQKREAMALLQSGTSEGITMKPVSTMVNATRNDHPGLIEETVLGEVQTRPAEPDLFDFS